MSVFTCIVQNNHLKAGCRDTSIKRFVFKQFRCISFDTDSHGLSFSFSNQRKHFEINAVGMNIFFTVKEAIERPLVYSFNFT